MGRMLNPHFKNTFFLAQSAPSGKVQASGYNLHRADSQVLVVCIMAALRMTGLIQSRVMRVSGYNLCSKDRVGQYRIWYFCIHTYIYRTMCGVCVCAYLPYTINSLPNCRKFKLIPAYTK